MFDTHGPEGNTYRNCTGLPTWQAQPMTKGKQPDAPTCLNRP